MNMQESHITESMEHSEEDHSQSETHESMEHSEEDHSQSGTHEHARITHHRINGT